MSASKDFVPLIATSLGTLVSIRLVSNSVRRFMDFFKPQSDRTTSEKLIKVYKYTAFFFAVFFAIAAIMAGIGWV